MHMSSTNCSNDVVGSQPNFSFAFVGSPKSDSTSAGLKYLSSTATTVLLLTLSTATSSNHSPLHSSDNPKKGAALFTKSRTEYC